MALDIDLLAAGKSASSSSARTQAAANRANQLQSGLGELIKAALVGRDLRRDIPEPAIDHGAAVDAGQKILFIGQTGTAVRPTALNDRLSEDFEATTAHDPWDILNVSIYSLGEFEKGQPLCSHHQSCQKFLNRAGEQLGVAHRVLDVLVPEVCSAATGYRRPVVRQLVTAGVAKHMRMHREAEPGRDAEPGDQLAEARSRERRCPLRCEHERRSRVLLALEPAERPQLSARQGVDARRAALGPVDVHSAVGEVDGIPPQCDQLGRPQAVAIRDQHHGGVTVAVAVLPGGGDQAGNLGIGQVLAGADLGVWLRRGGFGIVNCPNNGGWRHQRQMRICHEFSGLYSCYCPNYELLWDNVQGKKYRFHGHNCDSISNGKKGRDARNASWQAFPNGRHHRNNRQPEEKNIADPWLGAAV